MTEQAKVFVTQIPTRRDQNGEFVPTLDVSTAIEHGEIVIMLPSNYPVYATNDMIRDLRTKLADYDFERGDCLIALGDPSLQSAAVAVVCSNGPRLRMLRWDRRLGRYTPFVINLNA